MNPDELKTVLDTISSQIESINKRFDLNEVALTENKNLKNEIIQLKKKIESYEKSTHENLLDKEQMLILQCLGNLPHDKMYPLEVFLSTCNLPEHDALFHLQELEEKDMVESTGDAYWSLTHAGRRYLIKHKTS